MASQRGEQLRGVLVAVSIPIFTTQLEKSRQATDAANLRSAYAEAAVSELDETGGSKVSAKMVHTGAFDKIENTVIGGTDIKTFSVTKGKTVTVSVDSTGKATFTPEA